MDLATTHDDEDDWELCNDDGFVYKRKKRRLDPPPPEADADADAATAKEEKFRRDRRKNALLKIRDRHRKELALWENLSSACHSMHDRAQELRRRGLEEKDDDERNRTRTKTRRAEGPAGTGEDIGLVALIDKLLLKAEAQEGIIQDVSNLCDVADSLCIACEEDFKQSLIHLPIWASPRDLMAALSGDSTELL